MDININTTVTMRIRKKLREIHFSFIFLFIISCEVVDGGFEENFKVSFLNFEQNIVFKQYKFIQTTNKNINISSLSNFGVNDLKDSIPKLVKYNASLSSVENNSLLNELSLSKKDGNILLLYDEKLNLVDYFSLSTNSTNIELKKINIFSESKVLKNNELNIIDQAITVIEDVTLKNATILISEAVENFQLKNTSFDNVLFVSDHNLSNSQVRFENITIRNSTVAALPFQIDLYGVNYLSNTYLTDISQNAFLFNNQNSTLFIKNCAIRTVDNFLNAISGIVEVENTYIENISNTFVKSIDETKLNIKNCFFNNIEVFSSSLNSDLTIDNSIFLDFNTFCTLEGQNVAIESSHIASASCASLFDLHVPNSLNFRPIDKLIVSNSNIDLKATETFLIFIYHTVQTDIEFKDSYLDFHSENEANLIRDDHPDFDFGDVIFINRKDEMITNAIGIDFNE